MITCFSYTLQLLWRVFRPVCYIIVTYVSFCIRNDYGDVFCLGWRLKMLTFPCACMSWTCTIQLLCRHSHFLLPAHASVLHGPGLGPRAGPARSPWAGPDRAWIIFSGPGRVRAWNLKARAGPGPVNINFAGRGPGLGLTFPGLGRARAYSESHYYFNIMVKDYLHLSIAKDHCFLCCKCNCTMQCISMASRQACQPIYYQFNTQQWSSTAELQEST